MRNEARFQQDERNSGNAAWVKDGSVILHLERVNSEFEFGGIYMFRFNDDNSLRSIARAENSGIDDSDKWILDNFRETRFLAPRTSVPSSRVWRAETIGS